MEVAVEEAAEEEAVEGPGEVAEKRPALDVNPWLSLPQLREVQAVFHERHEVP